MGIIRIHIIIRDTILIRNSESVFAFNENDIWFSGGVISLGWTIYSISNSNQCLRVHMQMNKIWGSSSNDLYIVGNDGNIAHYNGSSWTKIESGTIVDLFDVWGSPNGNNMVLRLHR